MIMNSALNVMSQLNRSLGPFKLTRANYAFCRLFDNSKWNGQSQLPMTTSRRYLFTDEVLGVDGFVDLRTRINSQFGKHKAKFYERLEEHLDNDQSVILSEDLKNLIFLCDKNPKEIALLQQAITKFEKQNESLRFGTFQFGPVVMRMAYHLNLPEFALMLMEKENINFYSQLSSVTIALDLLFKNGRYEDVVKLYNFVIDNYKFDIKFPADFVTLFLAACYKLNTLEAFDQSFRMLRSVKLAANVVKLRSISCFLALSINQNQPNIALEIIQQLKMKSFSTAIQSIRLQAFAEIGRFHDVCDILRFYLKKDKAANQNKVVFQETLDRINLKITESGKKEAIESYQNTVKNLEESGLIDKERTLDQALMEPINYVRNKSKVQSTNAKIQTTVVRAKANV